MIESYCDSIKEDIAKLVEDRMDIHKEVRFKQKLLNQMKEEEEQLFGDKKNKQI